MLDKVWNFKFGINDRRMSLKKIYSSPLFSGSALMIGGSMAINVINYIYHLVMGQIMGPESYGGLKSVFSLLYLFSIVPVSTSFAIVKFVSSAKTQKEKDQIYHTVNKAVFRIAVVLSILIVISAPAISRFLHLGESISVMMLSPILFFTLMALVNKATMQGMLKFIGVVLPDFTVNITKLILGVIFVMMGFALPGTVFAIVVGIVISYLVSVYLIKGKVSSKPSTKYYDAKPILRYSLPVLLQSVAFTALISNDILLVKHFLPEIDAGFYAAISTLGLIIYFAAQPITGVMFPLISGKRSRGESYRNIFFISGLVTLLLSVGVVSVYYMFPEFVIKYSVGEQYLSASDSLFWMGIFVSIYTLCYFMVNFILSLNKTKIVILPMLAAIAQISILWIRHDSLTQIIQTNVVIVSFLFVGLFAYLSYNELVNRYGK